MNYMISFIDKNNRGMTFVKPTLVEAIHVYENFKPGKGLPEKFKPVHAYIGIVERSREICREELKVVIYGDKGVNKPAILTGPPILIEGEPE